MMYRNGNTITRRIRRLLTGEVITDSVDCSSLVDDIQPNAGWFWYDFITYGIGLFHFENGLPDDINIGGDWMGDQWSENPLDKIIYANWLVK